MVTYLHVVYHHHLHIFLLILLPLLLYYPELSILIIMWMYKVFFSITCITMFDSVDLPLSHSFFKWDIIFFVYNIVFIHPYFNIFFCLCWRCQKGNTGVVGKDSRHFYTQVCGNPYWHRHKFLFSHNLLACNVFDLQLFSL